MWRVKHAFAGSVCVWCAVIMISIDTARADAPPTIEWTSQLGSSAADGARSIAVDSDGNIFICGDTRGSLAGPNAGLEDAYIAKYSPAGVLLWIRQVGTTLRDYALAVRVDTLGNAYVCGLTVGSLFGPTLGGADAFLAKYSPSGDIIWSRQYGTSGLDAAYALAVDSMGNAFTSGETSGNFGGPNSGGSDAFIAKHSPDGTLLWSRQIGTSLFEQAQGIAMDSKGNAFINGVTTGNLQGQNMGGQDIFIAKYSESGSLLWVRQLGTSSTEDTRTVAVDSEGNAYLCGSTFGSLGATNAGQEDAFIAKYSSEGALLWTRQLGTSNSDHAYSIAVDAANNAYIIGDTYGNLGGRQFGELDAFIAKYSSAGTLQWIRQFGTADPDSGWANTIDNAGELLTAGITAGSLGGPNAGGFDIFIARFVAPLPVPGDITGDGAVNVADLLAVINAWGACPAPPTTCPADIAPPPSGDGTVNVQDLLAVINNWG